ncbi:MAG: DUF1287 domain-containing protein [Bacillota bacterium]|jgi:uncharacterized protein YijF (DUF1287 family)
MRPRSREAHTRWWQALKLGCLVALLSLIGVGVHIADYWNLIPKRYYEASDFSIETVQSSVDYNGNGIDDYTDILLGAREDAQKRPRYDGSYHAGGYPPDNIGVCTDVIWRAFRNAGYCLKDMVDQDIAAHPELYPGLDRVPDPNIDFRRVTNLKVFFQRYAQPLTLDPTEIDQWQPGDIVTFGTKHIAIVSNRRNRDGITYIIHNSGQPVREEDALTRSEQISGHFRFDASLLEDSCLLPFR